MQNSKLYLSNSFYNKNPINRDFFQDIYTDKVVGIYENKIHCLRGNPGINNTCVYKGSSLTPPCRSTHGGNFNSLFEPENPLTFPYPTKITQGLMKERAP